MPERSSSPPPPRPVTSVPSEPDSPSDSRGRKRYWAAGLLAVGLGLAIILGVLVSAQQGSSAPNVQEALRTAGCTIRVVDADERRPHLATLDAEVEYNTFPPTNGLHYVYWTPWGLYRAPVNQLLTVHNLEHGGIVVQYGERVSDEDVEGVQRFYAGDRNGMVVAPLPELGDRIALQAWTAPPYSERARGDFGKGRLALCPRFDRDVFTAFRDAYRYRGPERFRPEVLAPGT